MDIRIGNLRVNLTALSLYKTDDGRALGSYIANLLRPKPLYDWNCATQTGSLVPPPANLRIEAQVNILVTDMFGRVDRRESAIMAQDLIKATGLGNGVALNNAFNTALPPLVVPIDWSTLLDPFKAAYSVRIMYQTQFLQCLARPNGMWAGDYFYVFVPHLVTFSTIVTGRCTGTAANGTALTGWSPDIVPGAVLERLERQILTEDQEAAEQAEREEDSGNPFRPWQEWGETHGGLLEDDDEPEEEEDD